MNPAAKNDAGGDPSRSKPISAGDLIGESDGKKLGGFLKHCHNCRKRIADNSDVFMYGDLRAFCSIECRDRQIAEDQWTTKRMQAISKEKK